MAEPAETPAALPTRVVVADDHRFLAQMLVEHLNRRGFEALIADVDDPELVNALHALDPGLILLDAVFHDDEDGGMRVLRDLGCGEIQGFLFSTPLAADELAVFLTADPQISV